MSGQSVQEMAMQQRQVEALEKIARGLEAINSQLVTINHSAGALSRTIAAKR